MIDNESLWVGSSGGRAMWVFDPAVVHHDLDMIYAFSTMHGEMREYEKERIRSYLATEESLEKRTLAIDQYNAWSEKFGSGFVQRFQRDKAEAIERRRQKAIERHKAYLKKHGRSYGGVVENSSRTPRSTHCYSCKEDLDSSLHVQCRACNWLICYCGACGCGYGHYL